MEQSSVPTGTNTGGVNPMAGVPPVGSNYGPVQHPGQVPGAPAQPIYQNYQHPMMSQQQGMPAQPMAMPQQHYPQQYTAPQQVTPVNVAPPIQQVQGPAVPAPVEPVVEREDSASQRGDDLAAAEDIDVIEKEWVDRAKQVVAATRSDPHAQEQEVSKLQSAYLKKRYGKDVVVPGD